MGAGGPPHRWLEEIRSRWPLSIHGVGASIGGAEPLDRVHLQHLKTLVARYEPDLVSEHLAWTSHNGNFFNDLLPIAYDSAALDRVVRNIDLVQSTLRRQILIENPATYVEFVQSSFDEIEFLQEVVRRSGCGLLLDVSNAYLSAVNHARDVSDYLARFPVDCVQEIHLAGYTADEDDDGAPLFIDSHDRPVADVVWALYAQLIADVGPIPTLIEWDYPVPPFGELEREVVKAGCILETAMDEQRAARHVGD